MTFTLVAVLYFLSGAAALVYQVSWQRLLAVFSGVHVTSITMIVSAFMAGLGFGGLAGGRIADRIPRKTALLAFGLCELAIGAFALASPFLYYDLAYERLGFLVRYPAVLPLAHFVLLVLPTLVMGASLPLLSRAVVEDRPAGARTVALLHGVNALGGAVGALATAWILTGALGISGTVRWVSLLNLGAGLGALFVCRYGMPGPGEASVAASPNAFVPPPTDTRGFDVRTWAVTYGFSGFIALSFELLWLRILTVLIKPTPFAFGHLLGLYLVFLALGAIAGAARPNLQARPALSFLRGQWGAGVAAAGLLCVLCYLPTDLPVFRDVFRFWATDDSIKAWIFQDALRELLPFDHPVVRPPNSFTIGSVLYLVIPAMLMGLPVFLMGWTFASIQSAVLTDSRRVGRRVGLVLASNVTGSMLGSLLTGIVFLDVLGTPLTFRLMVAGSALFALMATRIGEGSRRLRTGLAVAVVAILVVAIPDQDTFWARLHGSDPRDVIVAEDATSVVALQRIEGETMLRVDGQGHSAMPFRDAWVAMGAIPALVHANPRTALVIGLGTGSTAWAMASRKSLERIDVYEIARPAVPVLDRGVVRWSPEPAWSDLRRDPRVHVNVTDGRLALRLARQKYDLIEADPLARDMAFSGNFYSREFYGLVRDRLRPGGLFCGYVPTLRALRTASQVFPHVLWIPPMFMLAGNEPIPWTNASIRSRLAEPDLVAYFEAARDGTFLLERMRFWLDGRRVTDIDPERLPGDPGDINTHLDPRDEFDLAPTTHLAVPKEVSSERRDARTGD